MKYAKEVIAKIRAKNTQQIEGAEERLKENEIAERYYQRKYIQEKSSYEKPLATVQRFIQEDRYALQNLKDYNEFLNEIEKEK